MNFKKEKNEIKETQEIQTAPAVQESQSTQRDPLVILSEVDAVIHERLKSAPKTFEEIASREVDLPEGKHRLSLPNDIQKIFTQKDLAPRWINKDKRAIDHALDTRGWALVTRVLFSDIPKHYFTANGVIENGDAILAFMPEKRAERLRAIPRERSNERVKNLPIEKWKSGGEGYYKPTLSEEKDGEVMTSGIQPDRAESQEN